MEPVDTKPSGAAYQAPFDLSGEFQTVWSTLMAAVAASLHPLNILVAGLALVIVSTGQSWIVVTDPLNTVPLNGGPSHVGQRGDGNAESGRAVAEPWAVDREAETGTWSVAAGPRVTGSRFARSFESWVDVSPAAVVGLYLRPWQALFAARGWDFGRQGLACLLQLSVWSWAVIFVCRSTALRMMGTGYQWREVWEFANRHYFDALFSILIPWAVVVALSLPMALVGWFLAGDWTSTVAVLVVWLLLLLTLPIAVILIGLVLAWPLMFPAIACEGRDSFESISRAYAYVLQRPVHTVGVAACSWVIGAGLGLVLAIFFSLAAGSLEWSLSWGANVIQAERWEQLLGGDAEGAAAVTYWTRPLLQQAFALLDGLRWATQISLFWGLALGGYLLLRRYLDQTPVDELYRPERLALEPLQDPAV